VAFCPLTPPPPLSPYHRTHHYPFSPSSLGESWVEGARLLFSRYPCKSAAELLPAPHYIAAYASLVVGFRAVQFLGLRVGTVLNAYALDGADREGVTLAWCVKLARVLLRLGTAGADPTKVSGACELTPQRSQLLCTVSFPGMWSASVPATFHPILHTPSPPPTPRLPGRFPPPPPPRAR
jgi:hypothetical protein